MWRMPLPASTGTRDLVYECNGSHANSRSSACACSSPGAHVHLAIHRRCGDEMIPSLLAFVRAPVEPAEAEVAAPSARRRPMCSAAQHPLAQSDDAEVGLGSRPIERHDRRPETPNARFDPRGF
jgi:hypothetical protein